MMDGALSWLSIHAAQHQVTEEEPQREHMHLSGAYPVLSRLPGS